MADETMQGAADTAQQGGKMWTQAEVDAYAKARNDKQASKHAAAIAEKDEAIKQATDESARLKAELEELKGSMKLDAERNAIAAEYGFPAAILRGSNEKELREHAEQLKGAIPLYPSARDNGEAKPPATKQTREDFVKQLFGKE